MVMRWPPWPRSHRTIASEALALIQVDYEVFLPALDQCRRCQEEKMRLWLFDDIDHPRRTPAPTKAFYVARRSEFKGRRFGRWVLRWQMKWWRLSFNH